MTAPQFISPASRGWPGGLLPIRDGHAARCGLGARGVGCTVELVPDGFPKGLRASQFHQQGVRAAGSASLSRPLLSVFPFCEAAPHRGFGLHLPDHLGG